MPAHFSRTAIWAALWILVLPVGLAFNTMATLHNASLPPDGAMRWIFGLPGMVLVALGVIGIFGTTILGWIAVSQIRRSAGKFHGLWLAVFDGLLFPLMMLDLVIARLGAFAWSALCSSLGWEYHDLSIAIEGILVALVCAAVDYLIIRRVWRVVNKPAGGGPTTGVAPTTPPRRANRVFLAFMFGSMALGILGMTALSDYWKRHDQIGGSTPSSSALAVRSESPIPQRLSGGKHSAMLHHDNVDLHYAIFYDGDFDSSGGCTFNTHSLKWLEDFSLKLKNGRTFGYQRESVYANALLKVNGRQFDFRQGRVFVLHDDGTVEQMALFPPLAAARDLEVLAKLVVSQRNQSVSNPSFGPAVERVITVGNGARSFYSFDRGDYVPGPTDFDLTDQARNYDLWKWNTKNHVDIFVRQVNGKPHLIRSELVTVDLNEDDFDSITLAKLRADEGWREALKAQFRAQESSMVNRGNLRGNKDTFAFENRFGVIGLVQVEGITSDPPGVKLRYKLVQSGKTAQPAANADFVAFHPAAQSTAALDAARDFVIAQKWRLKGEGGGNEGVTIEAADPGGKRVTFNETPQAGGMSRFTISAEEGAEMSATSIGAQLGQQLGWGNAKAPDPKAAQDYFQALVAADMTLGKLIERKDAPGALAWLDNTMMPQAEKFMSLLTGTELEQRTRVLVERFVPLRAAIEKQDWDAVATWYSGNPNKTYESDLRRLADGATLPATAAAPNLSFGPETNGLQAAVELTTSNGVFRLGKPIDVCFHVRNVAKTNICIAGGSWRQDAVEITITDEQGRKLNMRHIWYSGWTPVQRNVLLPGESALFRSSSLEFLAGDADESKVTHPVGNYVKAKPGRYTVSCRLHFPDIIEGNAPKFYDWQGDLETAPVTVEVQAPATTAAAQPGSPFSPVREIANPASHADGF